MLKRVLSVCFFAVLVFGLSQEQIKATGQTGQPWVWLLLFDTSGSMGEYFGDTTKLDAARRQFDNEIVSQKNQIINDDAADCGLLVFGESCDALPPAWGLTLDEISARLWQLYPANSTPLADALREVQIAMVDQRNKDRQLRMVLISDGLETCESEGAVKDAARAIGQEKKLTPENLKASIYMVFITHSIRLFSSIDSTYQAAGVGCIDCGKMLGALLLNQNQTELQILEELANLMQADSVSLVTTEEELADAMAGVAVASTFQAPPELGRFYASRRIGPILINSYLSDARGDNDGIIEPNETVELDFQFINTIDQAVPGVEFEVSLMPASGIKLSGADESVGDIEPGYISSIGRIEVGIEDGVELLTRFNIQLVLYSAGNRLGTVMFVFEVGSRVSPPSVIPFTVSLIPSHPAPWEPYQIRVDTIPPRPGFRIELQVCGNDGFECTDSGVTDADGTIIFPTQSNNCGLIDGKILGGDEGVVETFIVKAPEILWEETFSFTFHTF